MTIRRTVKKVIDGDTFEVSKKVKGTNKIRIAGFSAPEINEKGGKAAASKLKRLIQGRKVTIIPVGRSFNRIVADVRRKRRKISKKL